jgi:sugar/nucleoside kinase (ribokinase family)
MDMARFDILGLGCMAVDDLLYVERYPSADCKTRVLRRRRQVGGLTCTALTAAARMGASCNYAGRLGKGELSQFIRGRMVQEGIGLEHVRCDESVLPVHSIIIVDETSHTRNVFYDLNGAAGAADDWPSEQVICAARVLYVDFFGIAGMIRAARIALEAKIPIVADFESIPIAGDYAELMDLANHPILPLDFACRMTGCAEPADAARALWSPRREAVVVTCGAKGCWYIGGEHPDEPRHRPAYPVEAVDTTGCGDVFHGVYAATLARGFDLDARIRWASAAAAIKATACGGQSGIPTGDIVEKFLEVNTR